MKKARFSTRVLETRTATGREHFACQDRVASQNFILLISNADKIFSSVNMAVRGQVKIGHFRLPSAPQNVPAEAPYYVTLTTVISSRVKITCYFHLWRYEVFARKFTWCLTGVWYNEITYSHCCFSLVNRDLKGPSQPHLCFCLMREFGYFILFGASAVASMRPTEALASVKFWRISPIIFILHRRSSEPLRKDFVAKI